MIKQPDSRKIILLIHPGYSSFVRNDVDILSERYKVETFHYVTGKSLLRNFISQMELLFFIINKISKVSVLYVWFADYHSFLPTVMAKLFQKRCVIVLGGYDVTYIPSLKYGSFSNPIRKFCTRFSLKHAHYLLAVDRSLIREAKTRVKNFSGTFYEIPTGFDSKVWHRTREKENLVLTVGICDSMQRFELKGIDIFLETAKLLPDYKFQIIGMKAQMKEILEVSDNVTTLDYVTFDELRDAYSRAKVYAQFSIREGLPSVVCEAMLCECIPVGTDSNGIPTAIGDSGYILKGRTAREAAERIKVAMSSPQSLGKKARRRIQTNFTRERRKGSLFQLLNR